MKPNTLMRAYLIAALIEGVLSAIILLLIPGDPKNARFLGLSTIRLLMWAGMLVCIGLVGMTLLRAYKHESWLAKVNLRLSQFFQRPGNLTGAIVFSAAGLLGGIYALYTTLTTADLFFQGYFLRLAPWLFWLAAFCGQNLIFFPLRDQPAWKGYLRAHGWAVLALLLVLLLGWLVHHKLGSMELRDLRVYTQADQVTTSIKEHEIYSVYLAGQSLLRGENPYSRTAGSDQVRDELQLFTYPPIIYYGSWMTQRMGFINLHAWVSVWRGIFLFFNLAVAYLIFHQAHHRYNATVVGIFGALLWLFNRWTLHITLIAHFSVIAIFFLLWSLSLLSRHRLVAYLLFGLSLGVMPHATVLLPVYLMWAWQSADGRPLREIAIAAMGIGIIPLLASVPFLVRDAEGFIQSLLVSKAVNSGTQLGLLSFEGLFGWAGLTAKILVLIMILLIYLLAWRKKVSYYTIGLLVLLVFVDFRSLPLRHDMAWVVALLPLAIAELTGFREPMMGNPTKKQTISQAGGTAS